MSFKIFKVIIKKRKKLSVNVAVLWIDLNMDIAEVLANTEEGKTVLNYKNIYN